VMIDIVVVALGAIIVHAGGPVVAQYLSSHEAIAATQQGATVADKAAWMVNNNSGAYFIVLAGFLGFVLMYAAQAKAQVLNTYSGSLALSNLFDGLLGIRVSRLAMVVLGNIIGIGFISADILNLIASYLGILGDTTMAIAGVIIADYFLVRRGQSASHDKVEMVNWAGVIAVVAGAGIGIYLTESHTFDLGFLVSLATVVIVYPALRLSVLREGVGTRYATAKAALVEV
jgi:cytosine permease